MFRTRIIAATLIAAPLLAQTPAKPASMAKPAAAAPKADGKPTIPQFFAEASPLTLTAAKKADRVAWMSYELGGRNVYVASAPLWKPVKLTSWNTDDAVDLNNVNISDDGKTVVFVRGQGPNRDGWVADPNHDPEGGQRDLWAVRLGSEGAWSKAWKLATIGGTPSLSPDGSRVVYAKDGQLYTIRVSSPAPSDSMQRGEKPFIKIWGRQSNPRWSPDGSRLAFVSDRENHSFIAVYDMKARTIRYLSPSTDCDGSPTWSADSKRIAFLRRPGIPFGRQENEGGGGGGAGGAVPQGPPQARGGGAPQTCGFGGGFGGGGGGGGAAGRGGFGGQGRDTARIVQTPGWMDQSFPGGHRLIAMIADVTKCTELSYGCEAKELWHPQASDRLSQTIGNIQWVGDNFIFTMSPPNDDWDRWYSLSVTSPQEQPVLLTTNNGLIEGATSVATSKDGKTLYYCTNAEDIESRHIWAVPTSGGTPVQVSKGAIEMNPVPLANGRDIAVLYYDYARPASVAIVPASGGSGKVIFPTLPKDFPVAAHVKPEVIWLTAADSVKFSNQLFRPKDIKPGERRPALVFVHGGPARQMLPGYHYMQFYHWFYAYNQYLQSQGYIVLSVNYRSGIGYGRSFQRAANTNARGNSEYQDVLAAGKYLQTRDDVDPTRIGIWGLSYGGLLTAQALARNSDLFIAGADYAGVHLYGNSLDPENLGFKSSAVGSIDNWKSPVLLVHGDDDRNVSFSQTVGLVSLLRARGIYYELMVNPDDQHESFYHRNWLNTFDRTTTFLKRFVWDKETATVMQDGKPNK